MHQSVAAWFARRTSTAADHDVAVLARRKAERGLRVSVVLPARDEARTVGACVAAVASLRGTLVDEVLVVDGGSSDRTAAEAAAAGASVVQAADLLAEHGPVLGKGDSMWRSLAATDGDLIVFLDTDITDPHPRFVPALLGPLLADDEVQLVKAFYDRPIQLDQVLHRTGGGRVTELTARPLINLFWPELAGLVQPLAGEQAGRRALLEALPFATGYGVELALLVDTLAAHGADAIAQVDVLERIHRNQSVPALSRMAFGITAVAMQRLHPDLELPDGYVQLVRGPDGAVRPETTTMTVRQRPPLASLTRPGGR